MLSRRPAPLAALVSLLLFAAPAFPQQPEPVPRLEAGGPVAPVQALAFSPDGRTLYEAGFDKVVRVWRLDDKTGRFTRDPTTFRVPLGPGFDGAINALALSPDGTWLAAGGLGAVRGRAGFSQIGFVASARGRACAGRSPLATAPSKAPATSWRAPVTSPSKNAWKPSSPLARFFQRALAVWSARSRTASQSRLALSVSNSPSTSPFTIKANRRNRASARMIGSASNSSNSAERAGSERSSIVLRNRPSRA